MKKNIVSILAALALAGFVSASTAQAEEAKPAAPATAESHEAHHPEGTKEAGMGGGMMGKMDMDQMMGMMHQCMESHKDGKMCDHEAMEKCQQSQMNKGECKKMMKDAKKQDKAAKKK